MRYSNCSNTVLTGWKYPRNVHFTLCEWSQWRESFTQKVSHHQSCHTATVGQRRQDLQQHTPAAPPPHYLWAAEAPGWTSTVEAALCLIASQPAHQWKNLRRRMGRSPRQLFYCITYALSTKVWSNWYMIQHENTGQTGAVLLFRRRISRTPQQLFNCIIYFLSTKGRSNWYMINHENTGRRGAVIMFCRHINRSPQQLFYCII